MWSFCLIGVFAILLISPTHEIDILPEDVVEFGLDVGNVTFVAEGVTDPLKRHTRVQMEIPECQILSHVKVTISNTIYRGTVDLDADNKVVIISFGFLQPAAANYRVVAKSITNTDCEKSNPRQ